MIQSVLIIEDEAGLRAEVKDMLKFEGYEVHEAHNGTIGIEKALEVLPDLILCDIMMPDISGLEVLKALKNHPETMMTPFVFTTALAERHQLRVGMESGADDYLTKPFTIRELMAAIKARDEKTGLVQEKINAALEAVKRSLDERNAALEEHLVNSNETINHLQQRSELLREKLVFQELEASTEALRAIEAGNTLKNLEKLVERELKKNRLSDSEEKLLIQLRNEIRNPQILNTNRTLFQLKFNQTNPLFLDQLIQKFPDLTQHELTLASGIVLNLNNQQLSSMFNIDAASVRKGKYRLKKKMGLTADDQLPAFLHELNRNFQPG